MQISPSQAASDFSLSYLHKQNPSICTSRVDPLLIAVMEAGEASKNTLRDRIDRLGYPSLAFETSEDLLSALNSGWKFDCAIFTLRGDAINLQLEVLKNSSLPMLFLTPSDRFDMIFQAGNSFIGLGVVDAAPFFCSDEELQWKLRLLAQRGVAARSFNEDLIWRAYRFDARRRLVWVNGKNVLLKPLEFELALVFFRNIDSMLTREELYSILWSGLPVSAKSRKIDVCVSNVRKKLELHQENGLLLRPVYGRGYELIQMTP